MRRRPHLGLLGLLGLATACSSRDQSLGETRQSPRPIIVPDPAPNPDPDPTPDPSPNPDPNPTPDPNPNPDPTPTVPPCEDSSKHVHLGHCVPMGQCRAPITRVGYECEGDAVCCDDGVGCSLGECGGSGGSTMSQGDGGDALAGVGGKP